MTASAARIQEARSLAIRSFNLGEWRTAVDHFEAVYHELARGEREPWLGLIRAAAALHHGTQGRPHSARALWRSARAILEGLPADTFGIDVPALVRELDPRFAPLLASDSATAVLVLGAQPPQIVAIEP